MAVVLDGKIKPKLWGFDRSLVAPEWRELWGVSGASSGHGKFGISGWFFDNLGAVRDVGLQRRDIPVISGAAPTGHIHSPHGRAISVLDTGYEPDWWFDNDSLGDFTWWIIVMRANNTPNSGTQKVEYCITDGLSGSEGMDFNLGNAFGDPADDNKPRFAVEDSTDEAMWIDGVKQSGTNPADIALTNGQFYTFVLRATNARAGSAPRFFRSDQSTPYAMDGACALIGYAPVALSDKMCLRLSRDPFGPFRMVDEVPVFVPVAAPPVGAGAGSLASIGVGW